MQEMQVQSLGREDPLEEELATHSSILAWRIPWTEEASRLHFTGSQRVRKNLAHTLLHEGAPPLEYIDGAGLPTPQMS